MPIAESSVTAVARGVPLDWGPTILPGIGRADKDHLAGIIHDGCKLQFAIVLGCVRQEGGDLLGKDLFKNNLAVFTSNIVKIASNTVCVREIASCPTSVAQIAQVEAWSHLSDSRPGRPNLWPN